MEEKTIRLDKFLANSGVLSRRGVKALLRKKSVAVNGKQVTEAGIRLNPNTDVITVEGDEVVADTLSYYMLNKPKGIISTVSDERGRATVVSLIKTPRRIYPIGRLDKDTHGLLILTNDGELTHKLTHPRYHVAKIYELRVTMLPSDAQLKALRMGVLLEDGITRPAVVNIGKKSKHHTILTLTLHEGRNRQVRRMCETVGLDLLDLKRIAFGPLRLGNLKLGEYRPLTNYEIKKLKMSVAL